MHRHVRQIDLCSCYFFIQLSTRLAAAPSPFFEDSSWVDDYFAGDIYAAFEEAQNHQDAFFLFYAPWDVDSMRAREAMESVSNVLEDHTQIYFAAVNCWTSVGECFKEFGAGKAVQGDKARGHALQQVCYLSTVCTYADS